MVLAEVFCLFHSYNRFPPRAVGYSSGLDLQLLRICAYLRVGGAPRGIVVYRVQQEKDKKTNQERISLRQPGGQPYLVLNPTRVFSAPYT